MIKIQTKLTIGMQTRQTLIKTYQWCIQSPKSCNNNITCLSIIVKCPLARKPLRTLFWLGNTIQVHTVSAGEHNPGNGVLQMQENLWLASFLNHTVQGCLQDLTSWGGLRGGTSKLTFYKKKRLKNHGVEPHFWPFSAGALTRLETALILWPMVIIAVTKNTKVLFLVAVNTTWSLFITSYFSNLKGPIQMRQQRQLDQASYEHTSAGWLQYMKPVQCSL